MRNETNFIAVATASLLLGAVFASDCMADRSRDQKQAQLDAACEQAREMKMAPLREQFVEECVQNKEQPDRKSCETFYADYGAQSGNRAPLFYDLPECVEAFEFQNSQRQP
jgi:hypothetical protein